MRAHIAHRPAFVLLLVALPLLGGCTAREPERLVVIRNVTLVDPAAPSPREGMTVVIQGDRITAVTPAAAATEVSNAHILDGTGKYLLPGLWDMHVHTVARGSPDHYAALFLANGVTGVRNMGGDLGELRALRAAIAEGRVLAPRLVFGGRIDGPGPRPPYALVAHTPGEARAAVDSLARFGVDFIKIPSSLPSEVFTAVVAAAGAHRLPFAGHVPFSVTAREASSVGEKSLEHEDDLMLACTSRELELKAEIAEASRSDDRRIIAPVMRRTAAAMRDNPDEQGCRELFVELARHGTRVVPTLVVYQPYARGFDATVTGDERLRYIPAAVRSAWQARASARAPEDHAAVTAYFSLERTRQMHAAGVRLMTGTDAPLPYVFPGFAVHDELALLVEAGLSPREALHAATLEPAEFLGMADSLGSIAPGKLADLVLLDANPLEDIRHTRRIRAVMVGGRLLDRPTLDSLLAGAEAAAGR